MASDRDPIWDTLKERSQDKFDADRARFLQQAQADDDGGWTKHTEVHWSRLVNGERLDYWPSRKKFQYRGRVSRGLRAMYGIIRAAAVPAKCRIEQIKQHVGELREAVRAGDGEAVQRIVARGVDASRGGPAE